MKIGTADKENKYVLQLSKSQTVGDKEVVEFCHNHTQIPTVYIKAAAESYCQTIMHYLLMGYRVKVGDLGTFFLALDTKATATIEEAGLDQLMDIKVRFRPTKEFAASYFYDISNCNVFHMYTLFQKSKCGLFYMFYNSIYFIIVY